MKFLDLLRTYDNAPIELENLSQWLTNETYLQFKLKEFTEREIIIMIKIELRHKCRMSILQRLHSRYNVMRREREITELKKIRERMANACEA